MKQAAILSYFARRTGPMPRHFRGWGRERPGSRPRLSAHECYPGHEIRLYWLGLRL